MHKILFAQSQYLRNREFVVLTKLVENNNSKKILKSAIYEEGKEHIKQMYDNYNLLEASPHKFLLPKTIYKNDVLEIDYIDASNLESLIENHLIKGDFKSATKYVNDLLIFLDTFPVTKVNPYNNKDYVKVFDPSKRYQRKDNIECWFPGFHDINYDNFILKDGKYYFVDFEWCFDFPIPKDFLKLRAVFYLGIKLKKILQTICSPDLPCYNFYADVLIPVKWLDLVTHNFRSLQMMLDYEYNLLSTIYLYYPKLSKVKSNYKTRIINHRILPKNPGRIHFEKEITRLSDQIERLNHQNQIIEKKLNDQIKISKNYYKHIEELRAVNSKYQAQSYKMLERLENTKIAQFKPLRIFIRKLMSLIIRILGPLARN